ncbi:MAG TPA: hypothetical protein VM690_01510 [Gaiellaceae bacterium]|nr:hypothetical protein [Gaiellaceae bacterium]
MGSESELKAIQAALAALWPLDPEARARAVAGIAGALGVGGRPPGVNVPGSASQATADGGADLGSAKQFLASKAPRSDVERVAVLAYYLTHARGTAHFATKELNELNTEAAGPRFSNASYAASNATKKSGLLAAAPGGKKQITARGEALVEALPDRQAVTIALESMPGKPRRNTPRRRPAPITREF